MQIIMKKRYCLSSTMSCSQWWHTELVLMKHPYSFEVIGETLDDAVERHMIKWEEF